MTVEEQILDLLEERLKTVLEANGYRTSAGQNVYRNLEYATDDMQLPCLILFVIDNDASLEGAVPPSTQEQNHFLKVMIEGYIEDDERGTEAAKLRGDLAKLLFSDPYYNGLAEGYEGPVKITSAPRETGTAGFTGYASAEPTIFYVTPIGGI